MIEDPDYSKVECEICDVKDIKNTPNGVPGFWLKAMLNHPQISRLIFEKDRQILRGLEDVTCKLHTDDAGYDLEFRFENNDFFNNSVLKKTYVIPKENVIEKIVASEIQWKDGKNITEKKVKKKNKKGK